MALQAPRLHLRRLSPSSATTLLDNGGSTLGFIYLLLYGDGIAARWGCYFGGIQAAFKTVFLQRRMDPTTGPGALNISMLSGNVSWWTPIIVATSQILKTQHQKPEIYFNSLYGKKLPNSKYKVLFSLFEAVARRTAENLSRFRLGAYLGNFSDRLLNKIISSWWFSFLCYTENLGSRPCTLSY